MSFQPDILGFACNWCGYAGADGAGMNKLQYPTNIKLVRVMCLGRVDPAFMLRAFEEGYDGVILIGCHIGDCHYVSGNKSAVEIIDNVKGILKKMGIGEERLRIEEVSSGEAPKFAEVVNDFCDKLTRLGPNPLKVSEEVGTR
jgi:F420-non-reducing hydrogenase iron-sulfur subunit